MNTITKIVIVVVACVGLFLIYHQGYSSSKDDYTVEQVVEKIKYFDNLIQSGEIKYKHIFTWREYSKDAEDVWLAALDDIAFSFKGGGFMANDVKTNIQIIRNKYSFHNCNFFYLLDKKENFVEWIEDQPSKELNTSFCSIYGESQPIAFSNPLATYIRCMGMYLDKNNIKGMSKVSGENGSVLYKIDAFVSDNYIRDETISHLRPYSFHMHSKGTRIEYLVDPQKQFLPKEVVLYDKEGTLDEKLFVISYYQDERDNWFPRKMILDEYDKGRIAREHIYDFHDIKLNTDVSIDTTFPVGLTINDSRVNPSIKYKVLSPVKYSELQNLSTAEKENKIRILNK